MLIRIVAPHFVAGADVDRFAPIIAYMRDWPYTKIQAYCLRKGWELQVLNSTA